MNLQWSFFESEIELGSEGDGNVKEGRRGDGDDTVTTEGVDTRLRERIRAVDLTVAMAGQNLAGTVT